MVIDLQVAAGIARTLTSEGSNNFYMGGSALWNLYETHWDCHKKTVCIGPPRDPGKDDVTVQEWIEGLLRLNYAAYYARYPDEKGQGGHAGPEDAIEYFRSQVKNQCIKTFRPIQLLKYLQCFEYNICEDHEYKSNPHYIFLKEFIGVLAVKIVQMHCRDEYDSAKWSRL